MGAAVAYVVVLALVGGAIGAVMNPGSALVLGILGALLGLGMGRAHARRLARPVAPPNPSVSGLPAYKGIYRDLDIVGESYRQDALRRLWSGQDVTHSGIMIPEASNPHDANAVRVEIAGVQVGYLSRDSAEEYRSYMNDRPCAIPVHFVKGGPQGTIGVFTGKGRVAGK